MDAGKLHAEEVTRSFAKPLFVGFSNEGAPVL